VRTEGATGRGACEHHGLAPGDADVVVASLGTALAGVGGFCAASREIVDHQRLSGLGYCFSASLPPFLAVAAHATLDRLVEEGPATLLPAIAMPDRLGVAYMGIAGLSGLVFLWLAFKLIRTRERREARAPRPALTTRGAGRRATGSTTG
jgi:hypothetical protein